MDSYSKAGVKVWPPHVCLLSELCLELCQYSREELSKITVVLPTQRLVTCLLAMLAKQLESVQPPRVLTLEPFISGSNSSLQSKQVASDLLQELMIASIIRDRDFKHLSLGHEHEIKQLFNDISEHALDAEAFESIDEILRSDVFRAEAPTSSLLERTGELKELYETFIKELERQNASTHTLAMREKAAILEEAWSSPQHQPFEHLYFCGFTTIKAYFKPLLRQLLKSAKVSFWLSESNQILSKTNPLEKLKLDLCQENDREAEQSLPLGQESKLKDHKNRCFVYPQNSVLSEVANAIKIAKNHIQGGMPASQIAILLPNETSYGKVIRSIAQTQQLETNLAISTPLSQTSIGVWIKHLLDYLQHGRHSGHFLNFMTHPITCSWLKHHTSSQEAMASNQDIASYLNIQLSKPFGSNKSSSKHEALESLIEAVSLAAKPLRDTCQSSASSYAMSQLSQTFEQTLANFGLWSINNHKDHGLSQSSLTALEELLAALHDASGVYRSLLPSSDFFQIIKDKMSQLESRSIGYPLQGVQVLNLIESRYVPFQLVIILGCIEGSFPKALPTDYLIDDWLKEQIGLPGWQYVESLEDTTFQLLRARVPTLCLSYPSNFQGAPTVRSRFIEKLVNEKSAQVKGSNQSAQELFSSKEGLEESWSRSSVIGRYESQPNTFLNQVSATSLEQLIHCPYKYLMSRLKVKAILPIDKNDTREEGSWLHSLLEAFFTGIYQGRKLLEPFPTKITVDSWTSTLLDRLNFLTDHQASQSIIPALTKSHLKLFSWPRFVEHLKVHFDLGADQTYYEQRFKRYHEWTLGLKSGSSAAKISLSVDGQQHSIFVEGVLDLVNFYANHYTLIDYKRKSVPSQQDVTKGLSGQLPLYALAIHNLEEQSDRHHLSEALLGYWSILGGFWEGRACGEQAKEWALSRNLIKKSCPSIDDVVDQLQTIWSQRYKEKALSKEDFFPEPGNACTFCDFEGICRKSDPSLSKLMMQNSKQKAF